MIILKISSSKLNRTVSVNSLMQFKPDIIKLIKFLFSADTNLHLYIWYMWLGCGQKVIITLQFMEWKQTNWTTTHELRIQVQVNRLMSVQLFYCYYHTAEQDLKYTHICTNTALWLNCEKRCYGAGAALGPCVVVTSFLKDTSGEWTGSSPAVSLHYTLAAGYTDRDAVILLATVTPRFESSKRKDKRSSTTQTCFWWIMRFTGLKSKHFLGELKK